MPGQKKSALFLRCIATLIIIVTLLPGCSAHGDFRLKNVAKADIDMVADAHLLQVHELLKKLLVKLYKRNPAELKKKPGNTIELRLREIFELGGNLRFTELNFRDDIEAMLLCFDEEFEGDRVFTLLVGLTSMLRHAYNDKSEFFILDTLDGQKLYNSARNIEILVWRLSNKRKVNNDLFLLTNSQDEDDDRNLSFERLFGKMISTQDMMAKIIADKSNRTINRMVQSLATATFIPVGVSF